MEQKEKVIVICGPTASGKTALSIEVAKKINGEIISCDSMQIYKDMNIGTAKPTKEEMGEIKHYLIDYVLPTERYSVAEYKKDAKKAIKEVIEKGKNYYTYYAMVVNGEEKLYVKNLEEAEAVLQELKDKDSANKDNITIEEKYNTELATLVAKEDAVNQLYEEKQIESKVMVASTATNRKTSNRVSTSTRVSSGKANLGITLIEPIRE